MSTLKELNEKKMEDFIKLLEKYKGLAEMGGNATRLVRECSMELVRIARINPVEHTYPGGENPCSENPLSGGGPCVLPGPPDLPPNSDYIRDGDGNAVGIFAIGSEFNFNQKQEQADEHLFPTITATSSEEDK